jgi:parvulin-like peptidyl-prolyl isomerase
MKIALIASIFLLFYNSLFFSQTSVEPIATVGSKSISVDEFRFRYELTPQMFRGHETIGNELKQEFIYTLIAEKLLASYGESISLDTTEIVKYTLKTFEEMFVRDELYKRMIVERAKFQADSLLVFYISNASKAELKYLTTNSQDEAEKIYNLLKKGVPFDFFNSDSSLNPIDTLTITFGQIDEYTENEILTLPENAFSKPLSIIDQWYIFNVVKKLYPIIEKSSGWESEYKRLNKLAKERAELVYYKEYMDKIFSNLTFKANGKLLQLFAQEVFDILNKKKLRNEEQKKYFLDISDLVFISNKLGHQTLNSTFVKLANDSIPLKDFINFFRFEIIPFDSINHQKVLNVLNGKTRKFIEYKVLANEGYKLGLEKTPEVQKQFNMWKQNYFYQLVMTEFADSSIVTDDEVKAYYNQLNKGKLKVKEVNVVEVLVRDPETAERVLNELEVGKDIKELAVSYSIRNDALVSQGESGFKSITYFKEIGTALNQMKVGEIYGPMKVAEGYSIFKLIDTREDSSFVTASFDQINKELVNELRHLKMKQSINQFIAKLAKQNNITVNKELINTIPTTTHNSVVFRLLGFGGKISAVPLIVPNSEWVEEWLNSLKVIP